MKQDLILRVLKVLRIEKRPGATVSIEVEPKLAYTEDPTLLQPYQGLDIPHWRAIEDYVEGQMGDIPPIHERSGVDFQTTSAELNGWYPDAVEGEVVWGQDGSDVWVFTKRGANWSVKQEQLA